MHNFLLRYYLAEAGLNPDTDVQRRVVPPADMVANLRAGNIDGFLGPDPFNQRADYEEVGFLHLPTKDIRNGYPCCAFGTSTEFIQKNPNTFAALYRAVLNAATMARDPMPWQSMAVWMLTQMKRWGYVNGELTYKQIAEKVFRSTDAKKRMKELGQKTPDGAYPKFSIMGQVFDAAKAELYAAGFSIDKMG